MKWDERIKTKFAECDYSAEVKIEQRRQELGEVLRAKTSELDYVKTKGGIYLNKYNSKFQLLVSNCNRTHKIIWSNYTNYEDIIETLWSVL